MAVNTFLDFLGLKFRGEFTEDSFESSIVDRAADVYFKAAALETAIGYITGALVKSEMKTYIEGAEEKGEMYALLNVQPNPNQNASQFWNKLVSTLMLEGECLVVEMRHHLYVADSFALDERPLLRNRFQGVSIEGEQIRRSFLSDSAIHLTSGNTALRTLVNGLWQEYGDLVHYAVDGFKRGSGSKYKLTVDAMQSGSRRQADVDESERQDPTRPLKQFMTQANSTYIQHRGVDLQQLGTQGCESDAVSAMRKEIFETVATICHVPPPLIFGTMTNIGDLNNAFLTYAVDPIAEQISQEFTAKLFTPEEIAAGSSVTVDTTRISHIDIFEVASAIAQLIGAGFSLDEIRDAAKWPRIGSPESQEHLITRNFAPIDEMLHELAGGGETNG